jgi:single-strand DNA-binding protein
VAKSLNRCCFIGNLGRDVEMRYLPSGDAMASFSIACTETWKDKQSGEMKEQTEWIRCSVFGRLAEVCGEYLKKGSRVYIEGKFKTRSYEKDGQTLYATEIKVEDMMMLDGRPAGDGGGNGGGERRERSNPSTGGQRQPQERSGAKSGSAGRAPAGGGFDEMDDDIPFQNPYKGVMQGLAALGF